MTNEPKLDAPGTTTNEVIEQSKFWAGEIGWARIGNPADRNMDLVPDRFGLTFGCPECRSVWTELLAAGYTSERTSGGHAYWNGHGMVIALPPVQMHDFRAIRIRCSSGHMYDFDSYTRRIRKYEPPNMATMAWIGGGMVVAAYALTTLMRAGKL